MGRVLPIAAVSSSRRRGLLLPLLAQLDEAPLYDREIQEEEEELADLDD